MDLAVKERKERMAQLAAVHRRIAKFGTPEKDYMDSGLWIYLKYVRTMDSHDSSNPIKPFPVDPETGKILPYILHVFHALLRGKQVAIPKSRQIMMSWIMATFCTWYARTSPHRRIYWQSKKEDDAANMVSMGRDDPLEARMSFIEFNLTNPDGTPATWLSDPKILAKKGLAFNKLSYRNGSIIEGVPQGGDQIRSKVPSLFCSDESAFQDQFGSSFKAVQPCVAGDGRAIYVSSAGPGDFCDKVNDYPGFADGEDPPTDKYPAENAALPRGMRFWRSESGMDVLEVHYTADPYKDPERLGKEWFERESKKAGGQDNPDWQQEMEINWRIQGGLPVFPFASDNFSPILIQTIPPEVAKKDLQLAAGFDYGTRNPSVLVVWGFDRNGNPHAIWMKKWVGKNAGYKKIARDIKACPYWEQIRTRIVADPDIFEDKQNDGTRPVSIARLMSQEGVNFIKGKRGKPSADVRVARLFLGNYWADPQNPKAFICLSCRDLWESVRNLRWAEHRSAVTAARSSNLEEIQHKHNDEWDATAYLFDRLFGARAGRMTFKPRAGSLKSLKKKMRRADRKASEAKTNRPYLGAA